MPHINDHIVAKDTSAYSPVCSNLEATLSEDSYTNAEMELINLMEKAVQQYDDGKVISAEEAFEAVFSGL